MQNNLNVRDTLNAAGFEAKKSLGQNFLIKTCAIESITRLAAKQNPTLIIEIGAGIGSLSAALCSITKQVITVEIDRRLEPILKEQLHGYANHTLIINDFLKFDPDGYAAKGQTVIVGNLPYQITGKLVRRIVKMHKYLPSAVIMVQKEAAEKLLSAPCQKNYRAISVLTQYYYDITAQFDCPPDFFYPQPTVTSTVLLLTPKQNATDTDQEMTEFERFINHIFASRRKMLVKNLQNGYSKTITSDSVKKVLFELKIPETVRAEALNPGRLRDIFDKIVQNR